MDLSIAFCLLKDALETGFFQRADRSGFQVSGHVQRFSKALFVSLLVSNGLLAQVVIDAGRFKVESRSQPVIVVNQFPSVTAGPFTTISLGGTPYTFESSASNLNRNTEYRVVREGIVYRLWFSEVPIVDLAVPAGLHGINRDTEVAANVVITEPAASAFSSDAGIRLRGATSLAYPKKSYRLQLRNPNGSSRHESLFGLRTDRRWLMLAMYNEKMRMNNKISHDLWLDMHKLYYLNQEPDALSTIRSRHVLVFINNVYEGVYLFTEDIDKKQYKLKEGASDADVEGELYKGDENGPPNYFSSAYPLWGIPQPHYSSETWTGWELKHPSTSTWQNLYDFSYYVKETSGATLRSTIWSRLHKGNFIDYFLYINLVYASDNLGKNTFLAKYKRGEPYFYGVWDLDGTLGYHHFTDRITSSNNLKTNEFWDKLLSNNDALKDQIAIRWFTLRRDFLTVGNLHGRIQTVYDYLKNNNVYALEEIVQARTPSNVNDGGWNRQWFSHGQNELNHMKNFMAGRLTQMDALIQPWLTSPLPVNLVSFEVSLEENRVRLDWSTATEVDADRFEIEHSQDADSWTKVGQLVAEGDSEKRLTYSFYHVPGRLGVQYYRLKMLDKDGSSEVSGIKSVVLSDERSITVFPNPAKGVLKVKVGRGLKVKELALYDMLGREVAQQLVSKQLVEHEIEVSEMEGLYLLTSTFEDGSESVVRVVIAP